MGFQAFQQAEHAPASRAPAAETTSTSNRPFGWGAMLFYRICHGEKRAPGTNMIFETSTRPRHTANENGKTTSLLLIRFCTSMVLPSRYTASYTRARPGTGLSAGRSCPVWCCLLATWHTWLSPAGRRSPYRSWTSTKSMVSGLQAISIQGRRTTSVKPGKRPSADTSLYLGHPTQGVPCSRLPQILIQFSQIAPDPP